MQTNKCCKKRANVKVEFHNPVTYKLHGQLFDNKIMLYTTYSKQLLILSSEKKNGHMYSLKNPSKHAFKLKSEMPKMAKVRIVILLRK